ncbi:hypothetical protein [Corallococcus sp. AB011P]|uniref:hypothetical protein n=1 Tax=Corallococcus sp. AB011P TaxID=2316735 RepID=UPI0011C3A6DA|nr:hypothetical protein [Corallococcus sp. AB011P]
MSSTVALHILCRGAHFEALREAPVEGGSIPPFGRVPDPTVGIGDRDPLAPRAGEGISFELEQLFDLFWMLGNELGVKSVLKPGPGTPAQRF